jgi:hypothetical protein
MQLQIDWGHVTGSARRRVGYLLEQKTWSSDCIDESTELTTRSVTEHVVFRLPPFPGATVPLSSDSLNEKQRAVVPHDGHRVSSCRDISRFLSAGRIMEGPNLLTNSDNEVVLWQTWFRVLTIQNFKTSE